MMEAPFASALVVNHQSGQRPRSDVDGEDAGIRIKVLDEKLDAIHGEELGVALNSDNPPDLGLNVGVSIRGPRRLSAGLG